MELANFLLDPNIAYLVLVITGVLLINAILIPGTGALELATIFFLIITAYQVFRLPFNAWALLVLALGLPPLLMGVRQKTQPAMIYMVVAIALFEVGSVFLYTREQWWRPAVNPLLAFVVVILTSGYLWIVIRAAYKSFTQPLAQDLSRLIGKIGEARTIIHASGTVYVSGELWSATCDEPISPGTQVKVIQREGMILKVVPAET